MTTAVRAFNSMRRVALGCSLIVAFSLSSSSGALADDAKLRIAIMGWDTTTGFFGPLEKGVQDAGRDLGVDVDYAYPIEANIPSYTQRLKLLIGTKPDLIVVNNFFPDATNPTIKELTASGTPVVISNSAPESVEETGALVFVGEDKRELTGVRGGEALVKAGVTHGLYINPCSGNPACIAIGNGFAQALEKAGKKASTLNLSFDDAANPTAMVQAIRGILASDPSIDGIMSNAPGLEPILTAIKQAGREGKIKLGLNNISDAALKALDSGDVLFILDEQPYLQGYYSVLIGYQYLKYGMRPIAPVSTGPLLITQPDAKRALAANALGFRGDR